MASRNIKQRPNGKWRARYRDEAGKEHAKDFARKVDGTDWLDQVTASVVTGQYVDPQNAKMLLRLYVPHWRAGQRHSPNTKRRVDSALKMHILPAFGDRKIGSIRQSEVKNWVVDMEEAGAKPASIRNRFVWLNSMMKSAQQDRMVATNPCTGIKLPPVTRAVSKVLTPAEVARLIEKMDKRWTALVVLMVGTGLRGGEATGLCVEQVNFLKRTLVVDRQLNDMNPPALGPVKPGKKGAPPREIPLAQFVVDALSAHIAMYGTGEGGTIFQGSAGGFFSRDQYRVRMGNAFKAAGLPDWAVPHDLRHFYASLLIAHGEDVKVVQDRLGHASATMTLDTYATIWPGREDSSRAAVQSVFEHLADNVRTSEEESG